MQEDEFVLLPKGAVGADRFDSPVERRADVPEKLWATSELADLPRIGSLACQPDRRVVPGYAADLAA